MKMIPVNSNNISSVGYENMKLRVKFQKGSVYEYSGVPEEVFHKMMHAPSIGEFFTNNIKNVYPYQRIC